MSKKTNKIIDTLVKFGVGGAALVGLKYLVMYITKELKDNSHHTIPHQFSNTQNR